ncbi:MAG: AMP-binding protein, partial [Candidatus Eremiobacteraeota bacterium]|nr:AMP-binding protein [Candidatus Eremiobacteraeota bacterium]
MISSGHLDGFTRDHLPDIRLWPHLQYVLPELQYPDRLNCSTRLLDRHIECGAGERRCIVAPGTLWSYRDLYERANRIAHVLTEDLGVVSGNRVLLRGFNSPMLAAAWFAVMKIGAVAVTAMPLYRAGELRYMIDKAQVSHALCDDRLAEDLQTATKDAAQFERVLWGGEGSDSLEHRMSSKSPSFQSADTAADDVAIIGFTSGTTGRPKAAMHFHRDILSTCDTFGKRVLAPSANDLFCGSPPLGFTFGLGGLLLFPLDAGAATVLIEKAQAEPLLSAIEEFGVTVLFTAPVAYRAMGELVHARNLRSLRTCVSAGETLPPSVWNLWYDRTGLKIVTGGNDHV